MDYEYDDEYDDTNEERRQDVDGGWYTRDEFFDEYGGLDEWDMAGAPHEASTPSAPLDAGVANLLGLSISKNGKAPNKSSTSSNKNLKTSGAVKQNKTHSKLKSANTSKLKNDPSMTKSSSAAPAVLDAIASKVDVTEASSLAQCVSGPTTSAVPVPVKAAASSKSSTSFAFETASADDIAKAKSVKWAVNNVATADVPIQPPLPLASRSGKDRLNLIVAGHVDAGKSTLMGHLLVKLKAIDAKTLRRFKKESKAMNKSSFHFAWVMDEHGAEREHGITMDVGINHFETKTKSITLLDAPGHSDYVPKMISGAAQADVGILVVPASLGEFESAFSDNAQTKEHATLILALGVEQLIVAINKMDAVGWDKSRFEEIKEEVAIFLTAQGYKPANVRFVPVSGFEGHNIMHNPSAKGETDSKYAWGWYKGPSIIDAIDTFNSKDNAKAEALPLRFCINDIFAGRKGLTGVGGKIESGTIRVGDSVVIMPTKLPAMVKSLTLDESKITAARVGDNVEIDIEGVAPALLRVGNVICSAVKPVAVASRFRAMVRTLGCLETPLIKGREFLLHLQSIERVCHVKKLNKIKSGAGAAAKGKDGKPKKPRRIPRNVTAVIEIAVHQPICCERFADSKTFGRFLLREKGSTVSVGRILKILK